MRVLVVVAHPDDEILGCGGTMAYHVENGDELHTLVLAKGVTSREEQLPNELKLLQESCRQANKIIGVKSVNLHDFPDNMMDTVALLEIVKVVESYITKIKPDIIYTHHKHDLNIDHQITHQAVITACRPVPTCNVKTILCFEVPSSTEWGINFEPNWFVDITKFYSQKIKALKAYGLEMRDWPHSRSFKSIDCLIGLRGSTVGINMAEAFVLLRHIITEEKENT